MKSQSSQDERVVAQRRKINSEAYSILMIALIASMFVQQFLLKAPLEQYIAEFICFFGISAYILIRYITLGLNIFGVYKQTKVFPLVNSIVTGITVAAISGASNYKQHAERYAREGIGYFIAVLAILFISASISAFAVYSCFNYLSKRKQAKIERELDENEKGE